MKRLMTLIWAAALTAPLGVGAIEEASTPAEAAVETVAKAAVETVAEAVPETPAASDGLRLNFRGAPLNLILEYLSDAAGFIINKEADVRGTVDVWSKEPVSREEAVQLLNSVLRKNGYAVVRSGRILTIVSLDTAKTADLEVVTGSDPDEVERSGETVTQIIPVRYANATQLMNNLQVLPPTTATLSVNESANSLILVASKTEIRRMLRIVQALDTSIASVASIRVFPLKFADARQLATVVQQLFAPTQQGAGGMRGQFFNMMRGGPGGGPGMMQPGAAGAAGAGGNAAGSRVVASADEYSNSLVVSASPELMATIADMVEQIDQPMTDVTEVRVFQLKNSDPVEMADQITQLFPDESRSGSNTQGSRFQFNRPGGPMGGNQASSSQRLQKRTRVLAVPDQRTSSILISAASELMPQIEAMIEQLDSSSAKQEKVAVFELQNADPTDVYNILQDLFNRNNTMRVNSSRNSTLGQNNALSQRATQQMRQTASGNSTFGTGTGTRRTGTAVGF